LFENNEKMPHFPGFCKTTGNLGRETKGMFLGNKLGKAKNRGIFSSHRLDTTRWAKQKQFVTGVK